MNGIMPKIPTKSPYTGPIITLMFGNSRKAYYIPKDFLQNGDWINQCQYNHTILVPQVSEDVGHVIIHYMYTGEYQILKKYYAGILISDIKEEFRMALVVFFASEMYHLMGLNELAKIEITRLRPSIPIPDMLQYIDEAFRGPNIIHAVESKKWMKSYIAKQLKEEFLRNESFDNNSLFHPLLDLDLIRTLAASLTDIYRDRVLELSKEIKKMKDDESGTTLVLTPLSSSNDSRSSTPEGSPTTPSDPSSESDGKKV